MTTVRDRVKQELTADGPSDAVSGTTTSVKISGEFEATINIQLKDTFGEWINGTDQNDAVIAITEPRVWAVDTGAPETVRVNIPAAGYTSGTVNVDIRVHNR